ncbi:MAG: FlgD immunoglobulin-like domain containing protein, partial [bacterium]
NPFNPSTTIRFTVTDNNEEIAKINIFNSLGELVSVLSVNLHGKGTYETVWNGTDIKGKSVSSGVYLYSLNLGNKVLVKKMILSK